MKVFKYFILLFSFFILCSSFVQKNKKDDAIVWGKDYALTWDDFLGKPQADEKCGAMSNVSSNYNAVLGNHKYQAVVRTYFYRSKSWVAKKYRDSNMLKHEQIRFDLAEAVTREWRKCMLAEKYTTKNFDKKMHANAVYYREKFLKEEALYDTETEYGKNKMKQKEWNNKVEKQLTELGAYESIYLDLPISD